MSVVRDMLIVGIVAALTGNALAGVLVVEGDPNPPDWRGEWSTTSQIWYFDHDPGPVDQFSETRYYDPDEAPSGGQPPLGETHALVTPGDPIWKETDDVHGSDRYGIWTTSGYIDVVVDNHEPPNDFKWVWVQVTWAPDMVGYTSAPTFTNLTPAADPNWPVELIDEIVWGDGWYTSTYQWRIYPNPTQESFRIGYDNSGGAGLPGTAIIVDELVIDTWCIPEPATLGLLLLGGLAMLRRKRVGG
jgi:hypothetical protein